MPLASGRQGRVRASLPLRYPVPTVKIAAMSSQSLRQIPTHGEQPEPTPKMHSIPGRSSLAQALVFSVAMVSLLPGIDTRLTLSAQAGLAEVERHVEAARAAAGEEHTGLLYSLCEIPGLDQDLDGPVLVGGCDRGYAEGRLGRMDNLYFLGTREGLRRVHVRGREEIRKRILIQHVEGLATAQAALGPGHAAGEEHTGLLYSLCEIPGLDQDLDGPVARRGMPEWYAEPARIFDNLYFLGTRSLNSYAVTTSEGIVIIDPMFADNVDLAIVRGLEQLGLDPADITHVIVSHGHGDHYGGALQLQREYGAQVLLSAADWDLMLEGGGGQPKPARDVVVEDGEAVTIGDTAFEFTLTPGHTAGTLSTIFPVREGDVSHMVAIWGGTSMRENLAVYQEYAASARKFEEAVREAEVDVILSNHGRYDNAHRKMLTLADPDREEGDPHPFVIGPQAAANYLEVAWECAAAALVRLPSTLE